MLLEIFVSLNLNNLILAQENFLFTLFNISNLTYVNC